MGASFATISGYGPNGAIIHYRAEKGTCSRIGRDSIYLLDSGGQYLGKCVPVRCVTPVTRRKIH